METRGGGPGRGRGRGYRPSMSADRNQSKPETSSNTNRLVSQVLKEPKKLAHINVEINQMSKGDIMDNLRDLQLDTTGKKETVKKRLKNYVRKQRAMAIARSTDGKKVENDRFFDYLVVIDFECTCEDGVYDYAHEIIEFPAVLVRTKDLTIVDIFHSFVRPKLHAEITPFCTELTGISQAQVDEARPFLDVLDDFRFWLNSHSLGTKYRYSIVTDGPWDMGKFFQMQCLVSGLPAIPHDLRYWINLRRAFANTYRGESNKPTEWRNLSGMLQALQMKFEGREHCGKDDAKNIARIAIQMMKDGRELRINEKLMRRDKAVKELDRRAEEVDRIRAERGEAPRTPIEVGELSALDKERAVWRDFLPYKVIAVSKHEFLMDVYEECLTCSDHSDDDET